MINLLWSGSVIRRDDIIITISMIIVAVIPVWVWSFPRLELCASARSSSDSARHDGGGGGSR